MGAHESTSRWIDDLLSERAELKAQVERLTRRLDLSDLALLRRGLDLAEERAKVARVEALLKEAREDDVHVGDATMRLAVVDAAELEAALGGGGDA